MIKKFDSLKNLFSSIQTDIDIILELFTEMSGSVWLLDTGILLDTGYKLNQHSGGMQTPHAYRDQYSDDAPKEERLFIVYSLTGNSEIESANGGDLTAAEPEFLVRVYADKRWIRSGRDGFNTYMSLLDYLPDMLHSYGWTVSTVERVGDVDMIGFETYVFYVSGLIMKERG